MKRYQIKAKIKSKKLLIQKLKAEIEELNKQNLLFSDRNQQYVETYEEIPIGNTKKTHNILIGRIHFKQRFIDEDTGQVIILYRKKVVKINGEWERKHII